MGVWGPRIFQDDLACDIQESFLQLIQSGKSPEYATKQLLDEFLPSSQDIGVVWIALALVQRKFGLLLEHVKNQALEEIDSGRDLLRWPEGSKDLEKRRKELAAARETILDERSKPRKIPKPVKEDIVFRRGDLFTYRLNCGKLTLFRVLGNRSDKGGKYPIVEILDWIGATPPTLEEIAQISHRNFHPYTQFRLLKRRRNGFPHSQVHRIAENAYVERDAFQSGEFLFWEDINSFLSKEFHVVS